MIADAIVTAIIGNGKSIGTLFYTPKIIPENFCQHLFFQEFYQNKQS